ncbi:cytochrome P450 [Halalkalicoccus tibetensis]|uniref:Cytochrome P450 n=1 Tax=Halalkalicoccus tibetensis TaxID=175632 RepID=A0ABD5VB74_9EURY
MASPTQDGSGVQQSVTQADVPPGPDGWPLIGNTLQVANDPLAFFERAAEYGDLVRYELGGVPFTLVLHPEYVEQLLVTDSDSVEKFQFNDFSGNSNQFASEGVLCSEGEQWRKQRTLLQNAFTLDHIEQYGAIMTDVATVHVDSWDTNENIALNTAFSDLTLDILTQTLFDFDMGRRSEAVTQVARAINERSDPRNLSIFLPSWIPTPLQRQYETAMDKFEAIVDTVIKERRRADNLTDRDDLLSLLLSAEGTEGYQHSDEELRDQLLTFLFAGHETTSLALTYTVLLLTQNPRVRQQLRSEWNSVLGSANPTPHDIPQLTVTDRVLTESLRLYPPAFAVFRKATDDLELGGYRIPEGTAITIPQYRLHRDPRFYESPESFIPDRWTNELENELPEYAYFPFGGGPRHCIGMRFAMMELKLVLPILLQEIEFELLSSATPELAPGTTLQPAEDVRAQIQRRE